MSYSHIPATSVHDLVIALEIISEARKTEGLPPAVRYALTRAEELIDNGLNKIHVYEELQ